MARVNRSDVVRPQEVQLLHCVNRCVRRSFLCGDDQHSGRNYDHRRKWIRRRLEFLAGIFGIDILSFAVMSNHFHVVVRTRPDVVSQWSDEEIARRWWNLFPRRRDKDGSAADPTDTDLRAISGESAVVEERRRRLSCISWFMRCMCEVIARRANAEDECTGRFWEGRFRTTVLETEEALAACMAYVDLNPVRAGIADSLESSDFTSVQERIADAKSEGKNKATVPEKQRRRAGWLSPIALEPRRRTGRSKSTTRRADNKGCLPMTLEEYLQVVDWTGRQMRPGGGGRITDEIPPVLKRLRISGELWMNVVRRFRRRQHFPIKRVVCTRADRALCTNQLTGS